MRKYAPDDLEGVSRPEPKIRPRREGDRSARVREDPFVDDPPFFPHCDRALGDLHDAGHEPEPLIGSPKISQRLRGQVGRIDPGKLGLARRPDPRLPAERDLDPPPELSHFRSDRAQHRTSLDPLPGRVPPGESDRGGSVAQQPREERTTAAVGLSRDLAPFTGHDAGDELDRPSPTFTSLSRTSRGEEGSGVADMGRTSVPAGRCDKSLPCSSVGEGRAPHNPFPPTHLTDPPVAQRFIDRVDRILRARDSLLCVGLNPDPALMPKAVHRLPARRQLDVFPPGGR